MNFIRSPILWFKEWYNKHFYTRYCAGNRPLIDKLRCVKVNLKLRPYDEEFISINIRPLRNNIVEYVEELYYINTVDKDIMLRVDKIDKDFNKMFLYEWFRDPDGNMLNDDVSIWNDFIEQSIVLINYYNFAKDNPKGGLAYNAKLLQSHIINIEYIIDSIINQCKTK